MVRRSPRQRPIWHNFIPVGYFMELRHLRYFVAVADTRNFTRAAEMLHIAQPPLSRQIRQLEEELGSDLFNRDVRPILLTDAGRLLYENAIRILASIDQLKASMGHIADAERRRFVIGFAGSTLYGLLPQVIRLFRSQMRHLDISLLECTTVEQISALKEGRIDVGYGRLRIEDLAIRRLVLAEDRLVAVVPADDLLAERAVPVNLAELATRNLIVYPRPVRPSYADQVLDAFYDLGLDPVSIMEVRELQTAVGLVAAHAGICLVPETVQRMQRDDVCFLPIAESSPTSPITMIHRVGDVSTELKALIDISCQLHAGGEGGGHD